MPGGGRSSGAASDKLRCGRQGWRRRHARRHATLGRRGAHERVRVSRLAPPRPPLRRAAAQGKVARAATRAAGEEQPARSAGGLAAEQLMLRLTLSRPQAVSAPKQPRGWDHPPAHRVSTREQRPERRINGAPAGPLAASAETSDSCQETRGGGQLLSTFRSSAVVAPTSRRSVNAVPAKGPRLITFPHFTSKGHKTRRCALFARRSGAGATLRATPKRQVSSKQGACRRPPLRHRAHARPRAATPLRHRHSTRCPVRKSAARRTAFCACLATTRLISQPGRNSAGSALATYHSRVLPPGSGWP